MILPPFLFPGDQSRASQLEFARKISCSPNEREALLKQLPHRETKCSNCSNVLKWSEIKKCESACRNLLRTALIQPPDLRYASLDNLLHRPSTLFSRLHPKHYLRTLLEVQMMAAAIMCPNRALQLSAIGHIETILANVDPVFPPYNLERAAFLEQHGDVCHHLAASDPSNKGAFIRLLGQALIFYDRASQQYSMALGPHHPNSKMASEKAQYLRSFIHD
ncbi:MAG: hypothetical protein Q8P67_21710 [archaeon]|nr:hypothetical protein [archaeon]